ncbi:MAG: hypothetical protein FJ290_00430 [Planctomycetes bacterium]|nr:hypothetical protein [Planctomycetota bacterium]
MMGPATHFLFGMLCGAAIGGVATALRRRWLAWLPAFILACGFWAEVPLLLGARDATHPLANVFFGYAWLHPWLEADEVTAFFFVLGLANLMLLGCLAFLSRFFAAVDMVRWERNPPPSPRSKRRRRQRETRNPKLETPRRG